MPSSNATVLSAAVSTLTPGLMRTLPREAVVVGAHRYGLYLRLDGTVLPVVPSDGVALPTAVRLGVASAALPGAPGSPWGVDAGDRVLVGGGRVVLPGADVVLVRTWRPARVRRVAAAPACPGDRDAVAALLAAATAACDPWLAPATAAALRATAAPTPSRAECASGGSGDPDRTRGEEGAVTVAGLVGRGRGLTPSGDDALAGALLVAHALRASRPLATAVRARLDSTTAVSAAMLGAAADGFAAHPVVALVDAVVLGHVDASARALEQVVTLGHSSGRDLVTGVLAALVALGATTPTGRSAA